MHQSRGAEGVRLHAGLGQCSCNYLLPCRGYSACIFVDLVQVNDRPSSDPWHVAELEAALRQGHSPPGEACCLCHPSVLARV